MPCPLCDSTQLKKYGKLPNGSQKYLCQVCSNIFIDGIEEICCNPEINFLRFKKRSIREIVASQYYRQASSLRYLVSRINHTLKKFNKIKTLIYDNTILRLLGYIILVVSIIFISIVIALVNIYKLFQKSKDYILSYISNYKFWYGLAIISFCTTITFLISYSIGGNLDGRSGAMFYMQAEALLHGRTNLDVTWTLDLIPFDGKLFLAIPPLNGFLMIPFVHFWGGRFTETVFSLVLYFLLIIVQFIYVEKFSLARKDSQRRLLFIFLALGTMIFPCAVIASSWFNAVLGSCLFLSLAWLTLYYAQGLKQDIFAITLLAIASIGRFHLAVIFPAFILKAWFRRYAGNIKALVALCIPAIMFIMFVACWNWVRFGSPFSIKYEELLYADFFKENIQKYGFRNLIYIFPNIYHGIIAIPKLVPQFPFFKIDDMGNGILAISPLFIYILRDKNRDDSWKNFAWLCMAIIAVPIFTHCSTGWQQFGYRYFLDFFPFASFLLLKSRINPTHLLPLTCILISLWFNMFGAVLFLHPELFGA